VIETNKDIHSSASSATISFVKNKICTLTREVDLEVEERTEREEENRHLCLSYDWVNPKVREYFSRYLYSSSLRSFLSKT